jgi:hypothetical protein
MKNTIGSLLIPFKKGGEPNDFIFNHLAFSPSHSKHHFPIVVAFLF